MRAGNDRGPLEEAGQRSNIETTVEPTPVVQANDDGALFGAVIRHGAYGGPRADFLLPEDADPTTRRDRALAGVEATADGQDKLVIDQGIRAMNERRTPWSINDLRPLLPVVRKSLMGARVLAAAKRGEMVRLGYVPSTEPAANMRPVALWRPV